MSEGGLPAGDYLIDSSVYARVDHPKVASIWKQGLEEDRLVACGPFVMEALYSARTSGEASDTLEELTGGMRYVPLDASTWQLAFDAQVRMAGVPPQFHRRPPVDYLIAATAHQHELGVLHYDHDYELIQQESGLRFTQQWVAAAGSLEPDRGAASRTRLLRRGINARLAQFQGDEVEPLYQEVIRLLDERIDAAGKPPLRPAVDG